MTIKKVGIVTTCHGYNGIGKLSAMMANNIANKNYKVFIYIPIFPYYTYYFKIFKKPFFWLRNIVPEYIKEWILKREYCFSDILDNEKFKLGYIEIKYVIVKLSKKELSSLDFLILNGIGDVIEYQNSNVPKKIYLVNQIEENNLNNKNYKELFQITRKSFMGEIITHSDFMKKELSDHINVSKVVPNPISSGIWKFRDSINYEKIRRDILLYWARDDIFTDAQEIIENIKEIKSKLSITILARSLYNNKKVKIFAKKFKSKLIFNQNENQVAKIYLDHSFILYPNTYEGFGMPPVEALSCGCIPILRPNVGAASMYSINNFNSIHLTNDPINDSKKIANILNNSGELLRLRQNTKPQLDKFNPENYGNKILNLK